MRINSLQGFRAILFMAIFFYHSADSGQNILESNIYKCFLWGGGPLGVSFFFILSGFLEAINFKEEKYTPTKVKNKASRLFIYHIPFLILMIPMAFIAGSLLTPKGIGSMFANATLIQSWFPDRSIWAGFNGVSWFLSCLLFFILLSKPLILLVKESKKLRGGYCTHLLILICVGIEILMASLLTKLQSEYWCYVFPPIRSLDYIIGISAGILFKESKNAKTPFVKLATAKEMLAILSMMFLMYIFHLTPYAYTRAAIYAPFAIFCIWILAKQEGKISQLLGSKIMVTFGNYTFYFMMSHQLIIRYLNSVNKYSLQLNGILVVLISFAIMMAALPLFKRYEKKAVSLLIK